VKQTSLIVSLLIGSIATILTACGVQSETSATGASPTQAPPPPTAASLPATSAPTVAPATTLALGVSGTGEVKANQDADLVFQVQGTVAEVKVKEGDTVKQGDLLAILDTRGCDQQLHQAEAALASARAQQAALTEAPRAFDATAARAQVQQARSTLAQLKAGPKAQDLQSAQAALATAQANLQATRDKLSIAKTQAESQVQQAALGLTQAQARYAQAKSNWEYAQDTNKDPVAPNRGVDPKTGKNVPNKLNDAQRERLCAVRAG
jgi:multidrug efflux pump subunit AcrA (membrane-fusion protein)